MSIWFLEFYIYTEVCISIITCIYIFSVQDLQIQSDDLEEVELLQQNANAQL